MREQSEPLYIVWRDYQRRAEVVSRHFGAKLVFMPHRFRARALRPIDYVEKAMRTTGMLVRHRPPLAILQSPPPFAALPPMLMRIPYVVDLHNKAIQSRWATVPLTQAILGRAALVLAHNHEALALARLRFPGSRLAVLQDPIAELPGCGDPAARDPTKVLVIGSFGSDEPLELVRAVISLNADLEFFITAPTDRLDSGSLRSLQELRNLTLTGFLPTEDYHRLLARCGAAIVLTTRNATQPSGACEALSSDTPLVLSRTTLTDHLFGRWATLTENDPSAITNALRATLGRELDLSAERSRWNDEVMRQLAIIDERLAGIRGIRPKRDA